MTELLLDWLDTFLTKAGQDSRLGMHLGVSLQSFRERRLLSNFN